MGEVALTLRVMPENPEVDLDQLTESCKNALPDSAKWNGHELKPFAFGLKAIECSIIVGDDEGGPDAVQEALGNVAKVQGVELIDMGRLL